MTTQVSKVTRLRRQPAAFSGDVGNRRKGEEQKWEKKWTSKRAYKCVCVCVGLQTFKAS